ncbi:AsmA-like C-terminal domain-containing protein [Benzoatithermus flavus]|uniref:YhdP family protein n=1 Tax=Benzoatithermus flavus TaxID=3108223 RepID=UPI003AABF130
MRPLVAMLLLALALAAGIVAGLFWRLEQGPLSLAALQASLERLVARGSPFAVRFADPALAWSGESDTFALTVRDLELQSRTGQLVLKAPRAGIRVDAAALLLQQALVPVELVLDLPRMELARTGPRRLELGFAGQLATLPLLQATGSEGLTSLLAGAPEAGDPRLQRLQVIRIAAPTLRFEDEPSGRTFTARAAELRLEHDDAGWRASLGAEVGEGALAGRAVLAVAPGPSAKEQRFQLVLDQVPAQALAGLAPFLPAGALQGRFSGRLESSLSLSALEPGPGRFRLSASGMTLRWPEMFAETLTAERADVAGEIAAGWQMATIRDAELASGEVRLRASGELVLDQKAFRLDAAIEARNLDAAGIARFWPLQKASKARAWFAAHVAGGRAGQARLGLTAPLPWEQSGEPVAASLAFGFGGATLTWLDGMAPAQDVAGDGLLTPSRLDFTLQSGRIDEVELKSGSLAIEDVAVPDVPARLTAELRLSGPLRSALQMLDGERLRLPTKAGIDPARVGGQVEGRLGLRLPLHRGIEPKEVGFTLDAALHDAGLTDAFRNLAASGAELTLAGDEAALRLRGTVRVAGVPARLDWQERLVRGGPWRRRITVAGDIDAAAAGRLAVPWPDFLLGTVGAGATVTAPWQGARRVELDLDLTPATLSLPKLGLAKPAGTTGHVAATAMQSAPDRLDVEHVAVGFPGLALEAAAGIRTDPFDWRRLELERLQIGGSDLTAQLVKRDDGTVSGLVQAGRLDLRAWRERIASGGPEDTPLPPLDLGISAAEVRLAEAPLRAVAGRLERSGRAWRLVRLGGQLEGGAQASLDYRGDERGGEVSVRADDGGGLLEALGMRQTRIEGGRLALDAGVGAASGRVAGELGLRDFRLLDSPLLARIFTLTSFQGIASALSGQGIPIERLSVPFVWSGRRVEIENARLRGADIGARASGAIDLAARAIVLDGTVAPAYGFNRMLGQVPIVGDIMRGREADAALAATFSVRGDPAAPEITVNPLAALVPGIIRDLFRDLGDHVPADSPERDRQ